jgi:AcrR family transcriptional regulator
VPRPLGRPKDGVSAETRSRLLSVSRRAFAHDGFDATTNRSIADRTGITTGAIYHYYASKAELYVAVYDEVQRVVFSAFEEAIAPHSSLLDRFGAVLDTSVALNREDPSLAGFVVGVAGEAQRHPELGELLAPLRSVNADFLHRLVRDAVESGELADGVDPQAVEDLLNAVLSGLARFSNQTADAERHARAVAALKRFLAGDLMR